LCNIEGYLSIFLVLWNAENKLMGTRTKLPYDWARIPGPMILYTQKKSIKLRILSFK